MSIFNYSYGYKPTIPGLDISPSGCCSWMVDLKGVNEAACQADFDQIINSKELFWAKFCSIFAEKTKHKGYTDDLFQGKIYGNKFLIEGKEHIIPDVVEQVELFRQLALEAKDSRIGVNRVVLECRFSPHYFLRQPSQKEVVIPESNVSHIKEKVYPFCFNKYVKPCLLNLFESLGFDYSESKTNQLWQYSGFHREEKDATVINIRCKQELHFVYLINPAEVPASKHPGEDFYHHYKTGDFCDFTLVSSENQKFNIHKIVLAIFGGAYFQTLLSSSMKEMSEKSVQMDCSTEVLQTVVDYLYLGPRLLEEKFFRGEKVDLYAILQFAHFHKLPSLFKTAVNLLILSARPGDYTTVRELANLYQDEDLHRLVNHLAPSYPHIKV